MTAKDSERGNSSIYRELCGIYKDDTLPSRAAHLRCKMNLFLQKLEQELGVENFAVVDDNILCHLVLDYFADIQRLKDFHGISNANKIKIVAYTSYWLCRRKPIQFTVPVEGADVFINEAFVVSYIADELYAFTKWGLSEKIKKNLFYHLKYRHLDPQAFELLIAAYLEGALNAPAD
jgi:hypothetical protein